MSDLHTLEIQFKYFISKFYYSKIWKKINWEKEAEINTMKAAK